MKLSRTNVAFEWKHHTTTTTLTMPFGNKKRNLPRQTRATSGFWQTSTLLLSSPTIIQ